MIEPKEIYGLIVIGRKRATIGYLKGDKLKLLKEFHSRVPGKFTKGGQSAKRFERLREEGEKYFYLKISNKVNMFFLPMKKLSGIFVGGAGMSKLKFIKYKSLDYRLRPKIIDVVDTAYDGGYEGLRSLVLKVKDQIKNVKYVRDKEILEQFMKEISNESGLAIYGINEVQNALRNGEIDTLILSDKYESIEVISEIAVTKGTKIKIISSEIEEGEMLHEIFKGIVAILRYKLCK